MAKKVKKRVRREYTKTEEKELGAHSKANAGKEDGQAYQAHRSCSTREGQYPGYRPGPSALKATGRNRDRLVSLPQARHAPT